MMHAHFFNKPYEGVSSPHEVLLIVTRTLLLVVCCASLVIQHSMYKVQLTHSSMFMFIGPIYSRKFSMAGVRRLLCMAIK